MSKSHHTLETKIIHAGEPRPFIEGAVSIPVFQSSVFEYDGETESQVLRYIRLNNTPNHRALHEKLASLENAEAACVTASGMAAISTALLTLLSPGGHLLIHKTLYGGTHDFITKDFPTLGLSFDFIDGSKPETWESRLKPETKAIYVETITNPLMEVVDLEAVTGFAQKHGLLSMVDNTFASPVNFRPPEWGYDISLHSCTKYLNGHSDIVAGAVIGRSRLIEKISTGLIHLGGTLDPHACFLLHRGLKTLAVRIRYQNHSALRMARFLESHPAVHKVSYPGLESHSGHKTAQKLFDGYGGMISFEVKEGLEKAKAFMRKVQLPITAPSLGGIETLVTRPATTSHSRLSPEERQAQGVSESLIRLSIGLESPDDLIDDIGRALGG